MDTNMYTSVLFSWFTNAFFWVAVIGGMIITLILFLVIRKTRNLSYLVLEFQDIGRKKVNINTKSKHPLFRGKLKAGWFGNKSRFFDLWDYGPSQVMKTNDGRLIRDISSRDFQEINGKTAILCQRCPTDPKVLVPINKTRLEGGQIFNEVAPVGLVGAGAEILSENERELKDRINEILQIIGIIGIGLIIIFTIILTYNYVNTQTQESNRYAEATQQEANRYAEESIKEVTRILMEQADANTDKIRIMCANLNEGGAIDSQAP